MYKKYKLRRKQGHKITEQQYKTSVRNNKGIDRIKLKEINENETKDERNL